MVVQIKGSPAVERIGVLKTLCPGKAGHVTAIGCEHKAGIITAGTIVAVAFHIEIIGALAREPRQVNKSVHGRTLVVESLPWHKVSHVILVCILIDVRVGFPKHNGRNIGHGRVGDAQRAGAIKGWSDISYYGAWNRSPVQIRHLRRVADSGRQPGARKKDTVGEAVGRHHKISITAAARHRAVGHRDISILENPQLVVELAPIVHIMLHIHKLDDQNTVA